MVSWSSYVLKSVTSSETITSVLWIEANAAFYVMDVRLSLVAFSQTPQSNWFLNFKKTSRSRGWSLFTTT
ncbi:hypothetical protein Bca4012_009004 [Brassica carinata]